MMRKSTPAQWVVRVLVYVLGLLFLAFGVAISANSDLGISPVNSLPYVVSAVTPDSLRLGPIALELNPGNCVVIVFCSYILLQILILRRLFIAIGVVLYIGVELVPMPMEGLSLAIADKTGMAFHNMKIVIDCVVVLTGAALSFLCLRELVYIREGTIITAIVTGKVMAMVKKPLSPLVEKICFGGAPAEAGR